VKFPKVQEQRVCLTLVLCCKCLLLCLFLFYFHLNSLLPHKWLDTILFFIFVLYRKKSCTSHMCDDTKKCANVNYIDGLDDISLEDTFCSFDPSNGVAEA
jgi:hypothetical protein